MKTIQSQPEPWIFTTEINGVKIELDYRNGNSRSNEPRATANGVNFDLWHLFDFHNARRYAGIVIDKMTLCGAPFTGPNLEELYSWALRIQMGIDLEEVYNWTLKKTK